MFLKLFDTHWAKNIIFALIGKYNWFPEIFVLDFVLRSPTIFFYWCWFLTDVAAVQTRSIQNSTKCLWVTGFNTIYVALILGFTTFFLVINRFSLSLKVFERSGQDLLFEFPSLLHFSIIFCPVELLLLIIFAISRWLFCSLWSLIITSFKSWKVLSHEGP